MKYPSFIGGSNPSQAVTLDQQRTMNFYWEKSEVPGATAESALYPTPGVVNIATGVTNSAAGFGRGHFFQNGREFAVIGESFFEIFQDGSSVKRTIALGKSMVDDGLPATISSNGDGGNQLFVTSGGDGFVYDLTTNILTLIVPLFRRARFGGFIDGYFCALDTTSSTLLISELFDGTTWNTGTNFAQRSVAGDKWVSMKVMNRFIYLLGERTSEVWYNSAGTFPFSPHPSGVMQIGCAAPFSPSVLGTTLFWLGASDAGDGFVVKTPGFTPEVVSTYAVQNTLDQFSTIADAQGDSYTDLGHAFYIVSFPTASATWAYDNKTRLWAERGSWISTENKFKTWRPRHHAFAFGEHRMLDAESNSVYRMAQNLPFDDVAGGLIRRLRRAPALMDENENIFYPAFELDMEPGLQPPVEFFGHTDLNTNPQVMMRQSKDGGKTWGNERWAGSGKTGEFFTRVRWNRCGMGRRMVFEVSMTAPIPWRLTAAYLPDVHIAGGKKPGRAEA